MLLNSYLSLPSLDVCDHNTVSIPQKLLRKVSVPLTGRQRFCNRINISTISRTAFLVVCLTRFKSFSVHSLSPPALLKSSNSRKMSSFSTVTDNVSTKTNPLLQSYSTEHGIPPFAIIDASHYKEAFQISFVEHHDELKAIVDNKDDPSFDNTVFAFDRAGSLLTKIGSVYYNLCSSMCPPGN